MTPYQAIELWRYYRGHTNQQCVAYGQNLPFIAECKTNPAEYAKVGDFLYDWCMSIRAAQAEAEQANQK